MRRIALIVPVAALLASCLGAPGILRGPAAGTEAGAARGEAGKAAAMQRISGRVNFAGADSGGGITVVAYPADAAPGGVRYLAVAGPDGTFSMEVPAGTYNLVATVPGTRLRAIAWRVQAATQVNVDLIPTGAISGTVSAAGLTDLSGTTVYVPGTDIIAMADKDGKYLLKDVPAATYTLVASRPGYASTSATGVEVKYGQTAAAGELALSALPAATPAPAPTPVAAAYQVTTEVVLQAPIGAAFDFPTDITIDGAGNLYVADVNNNAIRKVAPDGTVTTLAGGNGVGFADGPGIAAKFSSTYGLDVDGSGNVYVADRYNHAVRKVSADGVVTTVAGIGLAGLINGATASARFSEPQDVALDGAGNLIVADYASHVIRKIDAAGMVTTVAGAYSSGFADGATSSARFKNPRGVDLDAAGNVYVTDQGNHAIRKIDMAAGTVTTVSGSPTTYGHADGATSSAKFSSPAGIVVNGAGDLFVVDNYLYIRKISGGIVTTVAGTASAGLADGPASAARFYSMMGVTIDGAGNFYVAEGNNHAIRKIATDGMVSTIAAGRGFRDSAMVASIKPRSLARDGAGNLFVSTDESLILKVTPARAISVFAGMGVGFGDGVGKSAHFRGPQGLAMDAAGNLLVADADNHAIRKVDASGRVSTLAGGSGQGFADGATTSAKFASPQGVAVDVAGNVYVADMYNYLVRKIGTDGLVSSLAGKAGGYGTVDGATDSARFSSPHHVAIDGSGNLYVMQTGSGLSVRKVTPGGTVSTLAGNKWQGYRDGAGGQAMFGEPTDAAIDLAGNLVLADQNHVRLIDKDGVVTTIAGTSLAQGFADGPGTTALFGSNLIGVAIGSDGAIYVADYENSTIRKITKSP